MNYTLTDLRRKEVVDIHTGTMLGRVDDIEINGSDSSVKAMIVFGRPKLLGILGRDQDILIKSSDITLIGRDCILVNGDNLSDITTNIGKDAKFLFK